MEKSGYSNIMTSKEFRQIGIFILINIYKIDGEIIEKD
jgi:hypothetical protein